VQSFSPGVGLRAGKGPSLPSFAESASFADSESLFADEARFCLVSFCSLCVITGFRFIHVCVIKRTKYASIVYCLATHYTSGHARLHR